MEKEELLQYYDYLNLLASSKFSSQQDAEDLVSETMLVAFSFMSRGGVIEHPKTWLANTLMHKFNNSMRKKYSMPTVVNFDLLTDMADEDQYSIDENDEAANLRRELTYLTRTSREVLIRYYFNGESVGMIASSLGIPEGTVKSRLSAGRGQIRKGLEQMENEKNNLPGELRITWGGHAGANLEPMSLVKDDLISQNLLILAYDKPLTLTELGKAIGIPTVYIESFVEKLVNGELMVHTDGNKYYSDFIIFKPEDYLSRFDAQKDFVHEHFDQFWYAMSKAIDGVKSLSYIGQYNERQVKKLERFATMRLLEAFVNEVTPPFIPAIPNRKDGGAWVASGTVFPAGFNQESFKNIWDYSFAGLRTHGKGGHSGIKRVELAEFDTPLLDSLARYSCCGLENYLGGILPLMWSVYTNVSPEEYNVKSELIECIPEFEKLGLFSRTDGKLTVDIPVMTSENFRELSQIIETSKNELLNDMKEDFQKYLLRNAVSVPPHIKNVPEPMRYRTATNCIIMAAVREAYERGLHLHDIDYCCPPVIMTYVE